jgi:hypothetical protein
MRPSHVASCCLVLALAVAGARGATKVGFAGREPEVSATGSDPRYKTWTVPAYGETDEKALDRAQQKAWEQVCDYLASQNPPIHWRPDVGWVSKHLVKARPPGKVVDTDDPVLGKAYLRTLTVEVGEKDYARVVELDRQELMKQRQLLLARVLAGLVALLVAVVGYLRLDEATKGYYTLWLRLGAVSLVAGVGLALLLLA